MIKPKLIYNEDKKVWVCITPWPYTSPILHAYGEGAKPKAAYEMWLKEFNGDDLTLDEMMRKMEYKIYWK